MYNFELINVDDGSFARYGKIHTSNGTVETPAFMPVATQGTVKGLTPKDLDELNFQILIANAYHLYLRPSVETIKKFNGIHNYMSWNKPVATDSGGFQILSLSKRRVISSDGVLFQSHLDGSEHFFTPQKSIEVQQDLNSDIMMCLDECAPYDATYEYTKNSVDLTTDWAKKCKEHKSCESNALFGIIQGGVHKDLRIKSTDELIGIDFDGYSIGGLGIGEDKNLTYDITGCCAELIPKDKVRYLMGIGKPIDIIEAVYLGVDLFDCVIPTRNARNGTLFTNNGKVVIKNAQYSEDESPLDVECNCYTCENFSKSYLRHIFMAGEIVALRLLTLHNLCFYSSLMRKIRESIKKNNFNELYKNYHSSKGVII